MLLEILLSGAGLGSAPTLTTPRDWLMFDGQDRFRIGKSARERPFRSARPVLGGDDLQAALGYPSREAFRQALFRDAVPVPVFSLPRRRGKFALVKDVASWLAHCHAQAQRSRKDSTK